MKAKQKGNLYILMAAFLWSTGGILLKYVSYGPFVTNGLRSLVAFLLFCIMRKSFKIKYNKIILAAALCLVCTNFFFVAANKYTTAANAIVIQYTAPIWVLVWNSLYKKKAPKTMELVTMLFAFAGTILFFFDGLSGKYVFGNFLALGAGLCFSGVLFINFLPGSSSEDSSMLAFGLSFLISLPWVPEVFKAPSASSIGAIFIIGIFQVGLAYVFFSKGSRLTSSVTASLIGLLEAIMNPFWVYLFYGEKVGRFALFGAVLILGSLAAHILLSDRDK